MGKITSLFLIIVIHWDDCEVFLCYMLAGEASRSRSARIFRRERTKTYVTEERVSSTNDCEV